MATAIDLILDWASGLRYWEQLALTKVMSGGELEEADYQELLGHMLQDVGLAEGTAEGPPLSLPRPAGDDGRAARAMRLVRLHDLQDVNALVDGQEIHFGPQITAIYGANGCGKSGYARVLACAAFARGRREVLPDVTEPEGSTGTPSACITVADGDLERCLKWEDGTPCSDLRCFHVFDVTSVDVHLTAENELAFSPVGLSHLTRLAAVTDQVRERLRRLIDERLQCPLDLRVLFDGESAVSKAVAGIGPDSDVAALRRMATLSEEDVQRAGDLPVEIARFRALDVGSQVAKLKQEIADLEALVGRIAEVGDKLGDSCMAQIDALVQQLVCCREQERTTGADQFRTTGLLGVGTDVWREFVRHAKCLADAESASREPYPQRGDACLLCRQPLSAESVDLIRRLWDYLSYDAPSRAAAALALCSQKRRELEALSILFFGEDSPSRRVIDAEDPKLSSVVTSFLTAAERRRDQAVAALGAAVVSPCMALPEDGTDELKSLIVAREARIAQLDSQSVLDEVRRREDELRELTHRRTLGRHVDLITSHVSSLAWARVANQRIGSTAAITRKHNEIFEALVTGRYAELFQQTLRDLGRPMRIRVDTRGQKGRTLRRVVLELGDQASADRYQVSKVLSEGEKRAVALCDFMTEVGMDDSCAGIVLDDPVTSLDAEWKGAVADWLVHQAARRQVAVFTHDLHFLYLLKSQATQQQIEVKTHWIRRGSVEDRPGHVFLDNSPVCEREYRSTARARGFYEKAKQATPADQETLLRQGFGALRTSYEAFVIFDLFNEVVQRFAERVSIGRLKEIVWDDGVAQAVVDRSEALSRYIEGHLPSDTAVAAKPAPQLLLTEIEAFDELRRTHRSRKR